MKIKTITNRYNVPFTFTELEDGNIQWSGDFDFCRIGYPNDYSKAYKKYFDEECNPPHDHTLSLEEFKKEVHRQIYDEDDNWVGPCEIAKKYQMLVTSNHDIIDMVDPSGGPYLSEGSIIFDDRIIKEFIKNKEGYLIITEKI